MLRQRIITAVIIAPIALACVFLLPHFEFSLFVGLVLIVSAWEWANFGGLKGYWRYVYGLVVAILILGSAYSPPVPILGLSIIWWMVALALVLSFPKWQETWGQRYITLSIGLLVLTSGWVALTELKRLPDSSYLICLLFFLIWGADIGAYFSGRAFGNKKLAPRVSPGKSWAGFFGGLLTSTIIAIAMSLAWGKPDLTASTGLIFLAFCALVTIVSVLGDLTISMFKRHRNIKDASNLLPGHGGFLDRIDSLLSAGPVFVLYLLVQGW